MPTYEYRCENGHDFEEFVLKISAAKSELPCPTCGSLGQRRVSAGGGLLFKGSGFYITDYGKDGKKAPATSPKSDAAKSESKADAAAAPSTPAAKSESKPAPTTSAPAKGSE